MTPPLDPIDAAVPTEPAETDGDLMVTLARLDAEPPEPGARAALMQAVSASPRPTIAGSAPLDVFAWCAHDLARLLDDLGPADFERDVTVYTWSVRELLAHLAAVEDHMAATLGLAGDRVPHDDPDHLDHLAVGAEYRQALRSESGAAVGAAWKATALATIERLRAGAGPAADTAVMFHVWPYTIDSLLVARAFEIWTHADDIRRATGHPPGAPPPEALRTMSTMSVHSLALLAPAVTDRAHVAGVRIVLTGAGGGVHDIGAGERRLTLVGDVTDYCRLVARRETSSVLEREGDEALFADLVAAMQAIAM